MILELLKAYTDCILPLDTADWKAFSSLFRERILRKGECFADEGKYALHFSLLLDGVSKAYYKNKDGMDCCTGFFVAKQWMGAYTSLLSELPSEITIQALTDCRLMVADFSSLESLYQKHPALERLFHLLVEQHQQLKQKRETEMAKMNIDERYLTFLRIFPSLDALLSPEEIAVYLHLSAAQLARVRSMTLMVGW
jgi:CRP-like cAMP-binding protein